MEALDPRVVLEATSALVALPSDHTEVRVQEEIARRLDSMGFDVELRDVTVGRPNLIASRGSGGPWLCTHADVHPPHRHPDPWTVRLEDGHLIGRGVVDTKGQIAALLAALEAERDTPATVVITCAEETTGIGSLNLDLPDRLRPPDGGIVLEPTDFAVCTAQAGCIDLEVRAHATSTHAYSEPPARSALDALHGALDALDSCSFLTATHPLLPAPRRRTGVLRAGEHLWRTPSGASARVSVGLLPGVDPSSARAEVEEAMAKAGGVSWEVIDTCEPIEVPADLPVAARLRAALGSEAPPAGMPSWTDAGNLLVLHEIPCVVFGAGQLASAHSDHEHVRLDDLMRLADVLRRLLRGA
jgi:acetylornithine deacetylase/succinyl-diaminopimelate desuccinylase-like protein